MVMDKGFLRQQHINKTSFRKVTDEGVRWIRAHREEGMTAAAIRDAFKAETGRTIGMTTIYEILSGKNHSDVS